MYAIPKNNFQKGHQWRLGTNLPINFQERESFTKKVSKNYIICVNHARLGLGNDKIGYRQTLK